MQRSANCFKGWPADLRGLARDIEAMIAGREAGDV